MTEEKEGKGIKIQDKRRFDAEGNERDKAKPSVTSADAPPTGTTAQGVVGSTRAEMPQEDEGINFSSFIMSLATQTLMQLGEMQPPPGITISIDKDAARQTIDILRLLQRKTKGNLDQAEDKLLDEILHALMMSYVKASS